MSKCIKSISIIENNFYLEDSYIRKWKCANFTDNDNCYHEMFAVMETNMHTIDSQKVNYWLEITTFFLINGIRMLALWK